MSFSVARAHFFALILAVSLVIHGKIVKASLAEFEPSLPQYTPPTNSLAKTVIEKGASITRIPFASSDLKIKRNKRNIPVIQTLAWDILGADKEGGILLNFSPNDAGKLIKIQIINARGLEQEKYIIGFSLAGTRQKLGQFPDGFNERPYKIEPGGTVFISFNEFNAHTYNETTYNENRFSGIDPENIFAIRVVAAGGMRTDDRWWSQVDTRLPDGNGPVTWYDMYVLGAGISPRQARTRATLIEQAINVEGIGPSSGGIAKYGKGGRRVSRGVRAALGSRGQIISRDVKRKTITVYQPQTHEQGRYDESNTKTIVTTPIEDHIIDLSAVSMLRFTFDPKKYEGHTVIFRLIPRSLTGKNPKKTNIGTTGVYPINDTGIVEVPIGDFKGLQLADLQSILKVVVISNGTAWGTTLIGNKAVVQDELAFLGSNGKEVPVAEIAPWAKDDSSQYAAISIQDSVRGTVTHLRKKANMWGPYYVGLTESIDGSPFDLSNVATVCFIFEPEFVGSKVRFRLIPQDLGGRSLKSAFGTSGVYPIDGSGLVEVPIEKFRNLRQQDLKTISRIVVISNGTVGNIILSGGKPVIQNAVIFWDSDGNEVKVTGADRLGKDLSEDKEDPWGFVTHHHQTQNKWGTIDVSTTRRPNGVSDFSEVESVEFVFNANEFSGHKVLFRLIPRDLADRDLGKKAFGISGPHTIPLSGNLKVPIGNFRDLTPEDLKNVEKIVVISNGWVWFEYLNGGKAVIPKKVVPLLPSENFHDQPR